MKRKWGVTKKALLGIIVFTLFFSILICVAGSLIFDRSVEKIYNDRGYVVASILLDTLDHDKIAEYTRTWEADDYYEEMEAYLHRVEDYSGAAFVYIAVPYEDKTMRYVYDSDTFIGDTDPIAASFDEIWNAYSTGQRPTSYLVRHSKKYGFLTSSCLPVKDSTGTVVALLFVDTYMNEIRLILYKFIFNMILISLILLIIFCVMNWKVMRKSFIDPVMQIRTSAGNFTSNGAQVDDALTTIKTGDEIEDLALSIHNMEKDIVTYIDNLRTVTAEKERIGAELNVATQIQADMLPRIFPPFPDRKEFEIYATMNPAKEVGGDFYDFFLIDDDHMAMVMADVSGKGVPAALFMVITKTLIKNRTLMGGSLSTSEILRDVNNQLCEGNDAEMFATVWLCILEISTGKAIISNAGHEHPVIRSANGSFDLRIYKHSLAVAAMPGIKFEQHEVTLQPGDTLFVYTDGVPEATDKDNTLYGTDRLLAALNKNPDADSQTLIEAVKKDIDGFVGDAPQFDDITMLCFKYFGNN